MTISLTSLLNGDYDSNTNLSVSTEDANFAKVNMYEAYEEYESAMENVNTIECAMVVMESYSQNHTVQMEGFIDAIKAGIEKLWEAIKAIGRFIKSFFVKTKEESKSAVDKTQAVAEEIEKNKPEKSTTSTKTYTDSRPKPPSNKPEPAQNIPENMGDQSSEDNNAPTPNKISIKQLFANKLNWLKMSTSQFMNTVGNKIKHGLKLNEIELNFNPKLLSGKAHGSSEVIDKDKDNIPYQNKDNDKSFNSIAELINIFSRDIPNDINDIKKFATERIDEINASSDNDAANRIKGYTTKISERYKIVIDNANMLKSELKQKTRVKAIHIKSIYNDILKLEQGSKLAEIISNIEGIIKLMNDRYKGYENAKSDDEKIKGIRQNISSAYKSAVQVLGQLTKLVKEVISILSACLADVEKCCEAYLKNAIDGSNEGDNPPENTNSNSDTQSAA